MRVWVRSEMVYIMATVDLGLDRYTKDTIYGYMGIKYGV